MGLLIWLPLQFPKPCQRYELHFPLVSGHLGFARERNLAHLALPVANFELAEGRQFQREAVDFDVGGKYRKNAVCHNVDHVVGLAVGTQVECFSN